MSSSPPERPADADVSPPGRDAVPRHIAVIMDGNGRWAAERGLSRRKGHEAGVEAVRTVLRACRDRGVEVLTLYAFSSENWRRPRAEVSALMRLLQSYLRAEAEKLREDGVRLRAVGDLDTLPKAARTELDRAVELTANNTGGTLVLALSYGGRDEIVRAARSLARKVADGTLDPEMIDEARFAAALDTGDLPDPDLVVRTAGEMRLSNFLLWQASYAEYYSAPVFWPDFDESELDRAIAEYGRRVRKFGGLASDGT